MTDPYTRRLAALRKTIADHGFDGFVVPHSDAHQSESLPPSEERLAWLTGFTGSAGTAVVLADKAAMFVDGRYTSQVVDQVDGDAYVFCHLIETPPRAWLRDNLAAGQQVAYDPWLHSQAEVEGLAKACAAADATLVASPANLIDAIWSDRPAPPTAPVVPHDIAYAGRSAADKRADIAAALTEAGAAAAVLTLPDSIAWLLNIRGADVADSPLPMSFAVVRDDASVGLFIDPAKVGPDLGGHLGNAVAVAPPADFGPALDALAGSTVRVAADSAPAWVADRLTAAGATIDRGVDPCQLPKAVKNPVEVDGTRAAHVRDAAALCRFLAWLDATAPAGGLTEIAASDHLAALRAEHEAFKGQSFGTISGFGANGAIDHYRATPESNAVLRPGSLYLVDSGAQYLDGTTDVTRTVAIGEPAPRHRDAFTRVLKGHIALATARFPVGASGAQLDTLARQFLWQAGLDYDHGTGHGVGSYLNVHEGPQRISKAGTTPLQTGMIVSNEPGYYKPGDFGIRTENLVVVIPWPDDDGAERPTLGFETLTLAPIDRRLIDFTMLDGAEIAWLDAYHARVRDAVSPLVDADTTAWLTAATSP